MNIGKSIKLLGLIVVVAAVNIVVWSPGLLAVRLGGGNALSAAAGITVLVMSAIVLIRGSYMLLVKAPQPVRVQEIRTVDDYRDALLAYRKTKGLKKDIALAVDQLDRLPKKKQALTDVLRQRFDPGELSYRKFQSVIDEVEKLFYLNIRAVLNKLSVFDAADFSELAGQQRNAQLATRLMQEKAELYRVYMNHVAGYLGANEEILLKLDKLLLEISLLGNAKYQDIDEMPGMKEIDTLIKQTKYYDQ